MPTFTSKHTNLRLTRRCHLETQVPGLGSYRTLEQPVRYQFQSRGDRLGVLEVEDGQDMMADGAPIRDERTNAVIGFEVQDAVTWLRAQPEYNNREMVGGFTEEGREPERIPDAGPRVGEIIAALARLDRAALEGYAAEEEAAPYDRESVTAALAAAFVQLEAAEAALGTQATVPGGEPSGTPGNGSEDGQGGDDLDAIDKMADLKALAGAEGLGLSFPPGTSKDDAREMIRNARASRELAAA